MVSGSARGRASSRSGTARCAADLAANDGLAAAVGLVGARQPSRRPRRPSPAASAAPLVALPAASRRPPAAFASPLALERATGATFGGSTACATPPRATSLENGLSIT